MQIAARYSHKDGQAILQAQYAPLLAEVEEAIASTECDKPCRPAALSRAFQEALQRRSWRAVQVSCCEETPEYYVNGYTAETSDPLPYREMEFVKHGVGVEVLLGPFASAVYDFSAKMTIFHNLGYIDVGIEIVPVKSMADQMSSGVSYFEQLVWDLTHRGVADIDIPVLVLGIAPEEA